MNTTELIEQLDQRYGNPHAKECAALPTRRARGSDGSD